LTKIKIISLIIVPDEHLDVGYVANIRSITNEVGKKLQ
jgi:hypothetical protein